MNLDVPTLGILTVVISVELSLGLALMGWALRGQPGLRPWVLSTAAVSVGALLMVFRELVQQEALALLGHALLFLSNALAWLGTRDYCGRPRKMRGVWLSLAAFVAWLAWFLFVRPSTAWAMAGFAATSVVWSVSIAWTFFRHGPPGLRASTRFAGGLFLLHGAFNLAHLAFPPSDPGTPPNGWPESSIYLEGIVTLLARVLTLISLLSYRLLADLRAASRTDALTGLLNRRAFEEDGRRLMDFCRRQGLPCAVLFFDLDHFKQVNDRWGHAAGDAALQHFASLVSGELRASDLFGRYGGEEFCLLMPGATTLQARDAGERLRALISQNPALFAGTTLSITVSVGISWSERSEHDFEWLVCRADEALYRAKDDGRDRVLLAG